MTEEDVTLAGEHALGLLDGAERARTALRVAQDHAFAAEVAVWEERLAPLFDEVPAVAPDPALWERIVAGLRAQQPAEVVDLSRRIRWWRGYSAAATAIAASLALFLLVRPDPEPIAPPPAPPPAAEGALVAALAPEGATLGLAVSYSQATGTLLVTPASAAPGPARSHELWLVPESGNPRSLGLVTPDSPRRLVIPPELRPLFRGAATLAVSAEPAGGSPTGLPTGPIVAAGKLQAI